MNIDIINNNTGNNIGNIGNNTNDFFSPDNGGHYFNIQHREIIDKLHYFVDNNQIPNIIFYGNNSCGKKYILKYFLQLIYKKSNNIQDNILSINCCHGKGNIKFIREELKLFSNSIIINNSDSNIKSVILLNADSLTIDAQSSLRRLIEVNNKSTRFFIVVNNYERLLKPIISRFCSIYFNLPILNGKQCTYNTILYNEILPSNLSSLKRILNKHDKNINRDDPYCNVKLIQISEILYNKGYSSLDLLKYIETMKVEETSCKDTSNTNNNSKENNLIKYRIVCLFEHLAKEFRNEKFLIYFLLNYIYFRYNYNIKKFL